MRQLHRISRPFGTEALNLRVSDRDPMTHKKVDKHLDRYGHVLRAFVLKRRLLRSEVWPRMHIIDPVPVSQQPHLKYQGLAAIRKSMSESVLKSIAEGDPSKIKAAFVISVFSEDYFKEMIDEYLGKVLISGKAPESQEEYGWVEDKAKELYRLFYFGEPNSGLEKEIEIGYLTNKQHKYLRHEGLQLARKKQTLECEWREQDQRMLQEKINWKPTDPNISDVNYRTFYHPLGLQSRLPHRVKYMQLTQNWTWWDRFHFKWVTSSDFDPTHRRYYEWVQTRIFSQIMNHVRSLEFTAGLNIPHDYMIQAMMLQIHFWMVINRLRQIGSEASKALADILKLTLQAETVRSAQSVNLKKSNALTASLERMLDTNSTLLEVHFNRAKLTKENPYKGIDSLVWTIAFAEKVERYSDEVYNFSDYLVQNVQHINNHTEEQLMDGIVQFDCYLVDPKCRQRIEKVNPPLSPAQFHKQFNSNRKDKDYYYSKIQEEAEQLGEFERPARAKDTSFSFSELLQPFLNLRLKYQTLGTMDHYNRMEEEKQKDDALDKKGTWKSQRDSVRQVDQEFRAAGELRGRRQRGESGSS